ncbi:UL36 very large tegument protein, partial [Streptomyces massasporeus]
MTGGGRVRAGASAIEAVRRAVEPPPPAPLLGPAPSPVHRRLRPEHRRLRHRHGPARRARARRRAPARLGQRGAGPRERRYAESRAHELRDRLHATPASGPDDTARLEHDLAWTRDDHARATARVADLTARLARLGERGDGGAAPGPTPTPPPAKRRPRGARYAWLDGGDEDQGPAAAPAPVPVLPSGGAAPRGARFGGAAQPAPSARSARPAAPGGADPAVPSEADAAEAGRAAANAVYALQRLRAQGRSGEAHALLCEALNGPPARLPALAGELHRAGLGADWSILLWEAASLPPGRLAAVAGALADAGRAADCDQLLRQGVARPVEELAGACAALRAEGHHREAHALLTAFVRVRAPEDAARLAAEDPRVLA